MEIDQDITSIFNRHTARIMRLFEVSETNNPKDGILKLAVKSNIWDLHDDIQELKEKKESATH